MKSKDTNLNKLLSMLFENEEESKEVYFTSDVEIPASILNAPDAPTTDDGTAEVEAALDALGGKVVVPDSEKSEADIQNKDIKDTVLINEEKSKRGGVVQQNYICNVLRRDPRYEGWTFQSNTEGQQTPDITITDRDGKTGYIEVKSREKGLVTIYDKGVSKGSTDIVDFDELLKLMAIHNNISVYRKNKSGKVERVAVESLPVGTIFEAILTQGRIDSKGGVECGRFGKLVVDPEALKMLTTGKGYQISAQLFCSHKPAGFKFIHPKSGKEVEAFLPRGTGDDLAKNKKIFFYNPKTGKFTEKDVKLSDNDTDWLTYNRKTYLAPDGKSRPASDSGSLSRKCFNVKRIQTGQESIADSSNSAIAAAYKAIINHWNKEHGGDDYFMVVSGKDIYPFQVPGRSNILKLPLPIFDPSVINSVSLDTYGKGDVDAVRLAIKIDMSFPQTLQSALGTVQTEKRIKEGKSNVSSVISYCFDNNKITE